MFYAYAAVACTLSRPVNVMLSFNGTSPRRSLSVEFNQLEVEHGIDGRAQNEEAYPAFSGAEQNQKTP